MNSNLHTKHDPSPDEQELIAFHLGEPCDDRAIRTRLETDSDFATLSESVAHTLRVFSAAPVPAPDIDQAWQRLRPILPAHDAPARSAWGRFAPNLLKSRVIHVRIGHGFSLAAAVVIVLVATALLFRSHHRPRPQVDDAGIVHLREPLRTADAQGMAQHLDRAERWLTAVNHTNDPLDSTTRDEGQQLLLQNAVYLQQARLQNDTPDAVILERLGRVLTTANHTSEGGLQLRVQMNTDGLLFELRILRQNQTAPNGDTQ